MSKSEDTILITTTKTQSEKASGVKSKKVTNVKNIQLGWDQLIQNTIDNIVEKNRSTRKWADAIKVFPRKVIDFRYELFQRKQNKIVWGFDVEKASKTDEKEEKQQKAEIIHIWDTRQSKIYKSKSKWKEAEKRRKDFANWAIVSSEKGNGQVVASNKYSFAAQLQVMQDLVAYNKEQGKPMKNIHSVWTNSDECYRWMLTLFPVEDSHQLKQILKYNPIEKVWYEGGYSLLNRGVIGNKKNTNNYYNKLFQNDPKWKDRLTIYNKAKNKNVQKKVVAFKVRKYSANNKWMRNDSGKWIDVSNNKYLSEFCDKANTRKYINDYVIAKEPTDNE